MCEAKGSSTSCFDKYWKWAIIFGAIQILMIQLPDLSYFCEEEEGTREGRGIVMRWGKC